MRHFTLIIISCIFREITCGKHAFSTGLHLTLCISYQYWLPICVWLKKTLLQRVRLAYLQCNPQNMTSLVCHCTECIHTQYASVRHGWLYIPLFCLSIQYQKLFWKVLKKFAKYRKILPKILRNNLKYLKEKTKNFENYCGEF